MNVRQFINRMLALFEKNRSYIAIGFLLLFLGSVVLMYAVLSGGTRTPTDTKSESGVQLPESSDTRMRHLDGVAVPVGEESFIPFAVMIENHPDARPLSGLSAARVVIEAPVEGGITRFMALFDPKTEVDEIGPVRSARPYYVEWADSWSAYYAHVGGSPDALDLIPTKKLLIDLNQFRYGNVFWRSLLRQAPHDVYTNMEKLNGFSKTVDSLEKSFPVTWGFSSSQATSSTASVESVILPYGGSFNVIWKYLAEDGRFTRYQAGKLQKDKDGSGVFADNIIVMYTNAKVLDSYGRLKLRTTGEGEAIGFRDGKQYPLTWSRMKNGSLSFSFEGKEYALKPGITWLEVMTSGDARVRLQNQE